jgi:hypothetical protein
VVATGAQGVSVDAFKALYGTTSTGAVVEGLGSSEHLTQYDGFGQMRWQVSKTTAGVRQSDTWSTKDAAGNVTRTHTVQYDDTGAASLRKLPPPVVTWYWKMWPQREVEAGVRESKFSKIQILAILNEVGTGVAVADVCRNHGIRSST